MHRDTLLPLWLRAWLLFTAVAHAASPAFSPIAVIFDPSAERLPQAEIRQAIERELERPVATDGADGRLAVLEISVVEGGKVRVRYQPPAGELERVLEIAGGSDEIPAIVSLAAENLVVNQGAEFRPPETRAAVEKDAAPASPPPASPPPVLRASTPASPHPPWRRRVTVLTRLGFFGEVSGGDVSGRTDAAPGIALRLELPAASWLSVGTELGLMYFSSGLLTDGGNRLAEASATLGDLSIVPTVTIARLGPSTELAIGAVAGVVLPLHVAGEGLASNEVLAGGKGPYHGEVGYRLGAAATLTHWLGETWAVSLAAGLDHRFFMATTANTQGSAGEFTTERGVVKVWLTEPFLQLGLTSRF